MMVEGNDIPKKGMTGGEGKMNNLRCLFFPNNFPKILPIIMENLIQFFHNNDELQVQICWWALNCHQQ